LICHIHLSDTSFWGRVVHTTAETPGPISRQCGSPVGIFNNCFKHYSVRGSVVELVIKLIIWLALITFLNS